MKNGLVLSMVQNSWADYKKASRRQKKQILDNIQYFSRCGDQRTLSRKYLIKLFGLPQAALRNFQAQDRRGRPRVYSALFAGHILRLHRLMTGVCAQRMKAAIPYWLPYYEQHYGLLTPEMRSQLKTVGSATIDRILRRFRQKQKGRSATRSNGKLKPKIPLKKLDEQVTAPGTIQADTVAH